ncbi:MAG: hypothetical protein HY002_00605 [Candidatus Rokubacteria bacterium]|nr:hypothetical protein [Candidatus Rokubacteria bacterium]
MSTLLLATVNAQSSATAHTILMNAVEIKGSEDLAEMSPFAVRLVVLVVVVAVSLASFGCAPPPAAEKAAAEQAMSAARAAGADKYASGDFAAATAALKEAEAQMGARKYGEAKNSYAKVKELADKAASAAVAGKAAVKAEVEQQLANAEKRWREVEGKVKAAAPKLKAEQKQAADADARSVAEALQAAKTGAGDDPLAAKDKIATVTAAADKWEAELKALPAAPAPAKKPQKK